MTGKRDFRADRLRNRTRMRAGTSQGKIVRLCGRSRWFSKSRQCLTA